MVLLNSGPELKVGARGEYVTSLQTALKWRGFLVEPDGIFGSQTLAAVKAFQSTMGLTQDGIVGPATWEALGGAPSISSGAGAGPSITAASMGGGGFSPLPIFLLAGALAAIYFGLSR